MSSQRGAVVGIPATACLDFKGNGRTDVQDIMQVAACWNNPAAYDPTYASIAYPGLYPGVDLVYDGQPGALKSTYHVAPSANPALIRWRYDGATALAVDAASGDLQISLPNGRSLAELAPVAWQDVAGVTPGVNRRTFPVSTVIGPTTTSTSVSVARLSPNPTRRVYLPAVLVR